VVTDPRRLVGTTPRQRLSAGQPIRDNETKAPVLVARNATVTILLQTPAMTLTAQGRATEDGARGETVRVMNLQSNKVVEAVVSAPDVVIIQLGVRTQAAALLNEAKLP
jgi:flagella basal body P-ring formation protein FlgA